MTIEEAADRVVGALDDQGIPYVLVGAFSSTFYGFTRVTRDVDFVAVIQAGQMAAIMARLGPDFRLDPQISFESATGTTRYIVEHRDAIDVPLRVEIFQLSQDEFDQQRFARRRQVRLLGRQVWLLTAEDVVVTKLRWYAALRREKDLKDVSGVVKLRYAGLDWDYIRHWCDIHGTRQLLEDVVATVTGFQQADQVDK